MESTACHNTAPIKALKEIIKPRNVIKPKQSLIFTQIKIQEKVESKSNVFIYYVQNNRADHSALRSK